MSITTVATENANTNVLFLTAHARSTYDHKARVSTVHFETASSVDFRSPYFDAKSDAEAFLAMFPKSARLRIVSTGMLDGSTKWSARGEAKLSADAVNGGANETGVKRYRSMVKNAAKLNIPVVFVTSTAINAYASLEEFDAAIA